MKKTKKTVLWAFAIIAIVLQTSCVTKMRTFGKIVNTQSEAGQTIPANFINTIPFTTDETGRFLIEAQTSNGVDGLFYINTFTSSMMSAADLKRSDATHWGEWPMDLRNYYGQSSGTEIYKIPSIQIAGATIDNTLWSDESKGCKHPTIGVDILQLMCWDFDTDNGNVSISSIENSKTIADKMKGYVCYENGLQYEKVAVKFPDANGNDKFIFDLGMGENYLEVGNKLYKKLKKIYTPEDKVIDGCAADFFPAVKCELAGATVTIPVVHYKKDGQNKIGAPLITSNSKQQSKNKMNKKTLIWTLIAIAIAAFGICLFIAQDVWATEFCFGLVFTILGSMLLGYVIAPQKKQNKNEK